MMLYYAAGEPGGGDREAREGGAVEEAHAGAAAIRPGQYRYV